MQASTPMWLIVAQISERFVEPFRLWPWPLGLLVGDRVGQAGKRAIAQRFLDTCDQLRCCRALLSWNTHAHDVNAPLPDAFLEHGCLEQLR